MTLDKLKEAFASKKFLMTIGAAVTIITSPLPPGEKTTKVVALIIAYVLGQGFVDGMTAHGSDAQEMRQGDEAKKI